MTIEPQMFVSGGFYLTRSIQRPDFSNPRLLPDRIVTASTCIAKFVPDTWCIEWTNDSRSERIAAAGVFGLDEDQLDGLISEVTANFDLRFGWPNVIWDLTFARSIANCFLADTADIKILELGLHNEYVSDFCKDAEPKQQAGFAPIGRQGIHDALLKMQPVANTGVIQGFEPLIWNHTLSCSWLCNGLETTIAESTLR